MNLSVNKLRVYCESGRIMWSREHSAVSCKIWIKYSLETNFVFWLIIYNIRILLAMLAVCYNIIIFEPYFIFLEIKLLYVFYYYLKNYFFIYYCRKFVLLWSCVIWLFQCSCPDYHHMCKHVCNLGLPILPPNMGGES